jgi:cytosine deaminase
MDPWYSFGSADMLEVAHVGLHVVQMTSLEGIQACFDAVTKQPAKILGLERYGTEPGCFADLVLLQAADPFEAIRLKATRLLVMRRGKIIAQTPEKQTHLDLPDRPQSVTMNFVPGSIR